MLFHGCLFSTWEYLRVVSEQNTPNYSPSVEQASSMVRAVLFMLNSSIGDGKKQGQQEKRMVADLHEFLQHP